VTPYNVNRDIYTIHGSYGVCYSSNYQLVLGGGIPFSIHLPRRIQGLGQSTYRRAPGDTWGTAQGTPRGFKHVPFEKYQQKHLVIEKNNMIYFGLPYHIPS
jgi:hypothetical protein